MMKKLLTFFMIFILLQVANRAFAQEDSKADSITDVVLLEKQWTLGFMVHTNGWGLRLRMGKNLTFLHQRMWEIEYSTYKSPKEIRVINPMFSDAKSYIYGKLNYVSFLRGGIGFQNILNRKPYWGGIQLSAIYYGGLSLGLTKPMYLYIIHIKSLNEYEIVEEKYNPEIHYVEDIYGRGSFLSGITQLGFYPGVYLKGGLEFEFGTKNSRINSLEAGGILDFSPIAIPIMAYNPKQSFFLTLYLSISMGKRHN
jgi:hypothetical protein